MLEVHPWQEQTITLRYSLFLGFWTEKHRICGGLCYYGYSISQTCVVSDQKGGSQGAADTWF